MEKWFQISNLTQENRKGKKKPSNPKLVEGKIAKIKDIRNVSKQWLKNWEIKCFLVKKDKPNQHFVLNKAKKKWHKCNQYVKKTL